MLGKIVNTQFYIREDRWGMKVNSEEIMEKL